MKFPTGCISRRWWAGACPVIRQKQAGVKDWRPDSADRRHPESHLAGRTQQGSDQPNQPLALRVKRGDEVLPMTLLPKADGKQQSGEAGWLPQQPFLVTALEPDMPGVQSGLQVGDEIIAVDGTPIHCHRSHAGLSADDQGQAGTSGDCARQSEAGADGNAQAEPGGRAYRRAIASASSPSPCRWKSCHCRKHSAGRWRSAESFPA